MYQQMIQEDVAALGRQGANPRHVEGFMRIEHSTLDSLSRAQFREEARAALTCVDAAGAAESEAVAQSFGL